MKNIKSFSSFNEEINIRKTIATGLLSASLLTGCADTNKAYYTELTTINNKKFNEYELDRPAFKTDITFTVGPSGFIGTRWHRTTGKSGQNFGTITLNRNVDVVYYDTSTFKSIVYADSSDLKSDSIELRNLKVIEETDTYKIYDTGNWFSSIDYIMVNNGYMNKENEFIVDGVKYTYLSKTIGMSDRYFVIRVE